MTSVASGTLVRHCESALRRTRERGQEKSSLSYAVVPVGDLRGLCVESRLREADLYRHARVLRVNNHSLVGPNIEELVFDLLHRLHRKLLVFAYFEFFPAAPGVNKHGHR